MPAPQRGPHAVEDVGDVTVGTFARCQVLDEPEVRDVGEQLALLVGELARRKLLLDFGGVEALAGATVNTFVTLHGKVRAAGGRLVLRNVGPRVYAGLRRPKSTRCWTFSADRAVTPDFRLFEGV